MTRRAGIHDTANQRCYGRAMIRKLLISAHISALALALAIPLQAPLHAQGPISTVERGRYVCELPAEVAGVVALEQPAESFEIAGASRYRSPQGNGTYLRRGDRMMMTSGPRNGMEYVVLSNSMLRKIENGEPGRLRCFWRGR